VGFLGGVLGVGWSGWVRVGGIFWVGVTGSAAGLAGRRRADKPGAVSTGGELAPYC